MTVNDLVDQALEMAKGVAEAARRLVSPISLDRFEATLCARLLMPSRHIAVN